MRGAPHAPSDALPAATWLGAIVAIRAIYSTAIAALLVNIGFFAAFVYEDAVTAAVAFALLGALTLAAWAVTRRGLKRTA